MAVSSPQVSNDVIWSVVGKSSCFAKASRKTGAKVRLTSEPFNVLNVHSRAASGLANDKSVSVEFEKREGKAPGLVVTAKEEGAGSQPSKLTAKKAIKGSHKEAINAINTVTTVKSYRPDLRGAALARYARMRRSLTPKLGKEPKTVPGA
eukprot:CAMPEP_0117046452 /NCGR_PEP_ID=MMETSP0472-20121206/32123_1 /TAXON_ID=693140 ORGANISM="Tiarina fusus, Strain LIS" /NCGR_SAMPLE_ID=MMETSP0472 /ASSEMBLY_ACC=CAM_ASM_000603 /LENGTH=149 /DNA_ID=CAMNT_0004758817 /DNA_START=6 /DNA_END=452 /DNA_ORIENTATION=+